MSVWEAMFWYYFLKTYKGFVNHPLGSVMLSRCVQQSQLNHGWRPAGSLNPGVYLLIEVSTKWQYMLLSPLLIFTCTNSVFDILGSVFELLLASGTNAWMPTLVVTANGWLVKISSCWLIVWLCSLSVCLFWIL